MKTKTNLVVAILGIAVFTLNSCKKCHECHYDKGAQEIEMGEYCDEDEIKDLEANGYKPAGDTVSYVVHCHE